MDLRAVGQRIREARKAKGLTQEALANKVGLSSTHISVIERGLKSARLETFVAIANILEVSADSLLIDVVDHSVDGVANEWAKRIRKLPADERKRIVASMLGWSPMAKTARSRLRI